MRNQSNHHSRRSFLRAAAGLAAATIVPRYAVAGSGQSPPSEKLNLAFIGAGGRAVNNLEGLRDQNIVALCDVDLDRAKDSFQAFSQAARFRDFRKMLDKVDSQIDGVVVSTPDHTHAVAAIDAIRRGKHVYCEKPLAHSIAEVRTLKKAAHEHKVVTQLGNQGHSAEHIRLFCEWIWDGAIGEVHTIHAGHSHPIHVGDSRRLLRYSRIDDLPRLRERHTVPTTLDWDLWLGPAAWRPYHPLYLPTMWRGWMPFGTGEIGDWVCHIIDPVFWALDLDAPATVQAEVDDFDPEKYSDTFPRGMHVCYEFPARGKREAVTLHWYNGSWPWPRIPGIEAEKLPRNTSAIVLGSEGAIRYGSHGAAGVRIMPEEKMQSYRRPEPTIPRVKSHYDDWIQAVRNGSQAGSNFDYGGPLTEIALLGIIASRLPGTKLQWESEKMRFTNCDAANHFLQPYLRDGWTLK